MSQLKMLPRHKAVSYTHLDVYKRQMLTGQRLIYTTGLKPETPNEQDGRKKLYAVRLIILD